ncbi:ESPR-type extended signal peptide-containing protein [Dialister invisus]|uniref:ESPR-type extended signal peptide-containing protein n=1 Tax=Dialister invisus TaxID=218538 RepID=UPI00266EAF4F|nr:ESPR-type extended signal peptide-containing protein [Dialister invisus]
MNKIYKIVWSKAKHAYVVTSEVARSHTKSASGKAVKAVLAATVGMGVLMGGYAADAAPATNPAGNGPGIAIGTGSSAPKVENVAIGQGAGIGYSNGASAATGDVAIGNGANINNYASQGGSIAIGKNAKVENMAGGGEASFAFGQTTFSGNAFSSARIPADPTKVVGSVAIGDNTFARTGSTMIGSHNYKGALGDTTVDSASTRTDALNVYATTIGANSFSNGAFTTSTGAYNIISGDYTGGRFSNATKNLGATITGSLNSIESKTGSYDSGIANTITGVANRTANSNGSLIYGAGNEITNSYTSLSGTPEDGGSSAKAFADKLRKSVRESESGGATLAIGGGNKADYTQKTSIIGVNNTVTGTSGSPSTFNSITGYNNTATNVKHVSVIGSKNNVTNTNGAVVFGDKRTLTGADGSVVIGSSQNGTSTSVKNAVAIGSEANVTKEGGVALGAGSVASVDKGVAGYDPGTGTNSTDTSSVWKSTQAAVSVGDASKGITRQITGVAAGAADTDAVNVAQLKKVEAKAEAAEKKHTTVKAGDYTTVTEGTNADGGKEYTVSGPKMESTDGTVKITDKVENGKKVGYNLSVDTSSLGIEKTKVEAGDNVTVTSKKTGNTTTYTVNAKDTVVTGGTATYAANGTGSATLINNDGTTATITGLKDRYTSSAALDGNTLNFTRNDGSTYSVSGIASTQDIKNVTNKVGELGTRVNRAGAGAAALAALHPLDFDPDDKWDVAAGYGNYKDAHAVAVGAFYRPNEDTMFSVGGSFGGGENMVNAGVSVKLGQGNHVSTSKVAMAKEIVDLKDAVTRLEAQNEQFRQIIGQMAGQPVRNVEFPDVPKDHWAYSYVKSLADRGLLEGYPDGEFKGDRSMTRYEFAAIIYRALQNGAPVDGNVGKAMEEFGPEMEKVREAYRFRVDRISGEDNDRNKVERVRVNNEGNKEKGDYRDIYGSHIAASK